MASCYSALFLSLALLFSTQSLSSAAPSIPPSLEKVSLSLYYETLCPGCTDFMIKDLPKIFEKGLIDIVDLSLIPYGNAFVDQNNNIICQSFCKSPDKNKACMRFTSTYTSNKPALLNEHGQKECFLNTVEACAVHVWPILKEHFKFIYCLEDYISKGESSGWGSCLRRMPLQGKPIIDCYFSGLGQKLELHYANETNALNPPHQYVPWVTVNKVPLYEDTGNFIKYICDAYKGTSLPKACQELTADVIPEGESDQTLEVCLVNDAFPTTKSGLKDLHGGTKMKF